MAASVSSTGSFKELVQLAVEYRAAGDTCDCTLLLLQLAAGLHMQPTSSDEPNGVPPPLTLVECITGKLDMIELAASPPSGSSRQYKGMSASSSIPLCGLLPALQCSSSQDTRKGAAAVALACLQVATQHNSQRATSGAMRCVTSAFADEAIGVRTAAYQCVLQPQGCTSQPLLQAAWMDGVGWLPFGLGALGSRVMWGVLRDAAHVPLPTLQWAVQCLGAAGGRLDSPTRIAHAVGAIACFACDEHVGSGLVHVLGLKSVATSSPGGMQALPLLRSLLCPNLRTQARVQEDVNSALKASGLSSDALQAAASLVAGLLGET